MNKPQRHQERQQLPALQAEQAALSLQQRTLFFSQQNETAHEVLS